MKIPKREVRPSSHARYEWEIFTPKALSSTGKPYRDYFHSEDEANEELSRMEEEIRLSGTALASMPIELRVDAIRAYGRIKHIDGATLDKCAEEFAARYAAANRAIPLGQLMDEFLHNRKTRRNPISDKSLKDADHCFQVLLVRLPKESNIATLTAEMTQNAFGDLEKLAVELELRRVQIKRAKLIAEFERKRAEWDRKKQTAKAMPPPLRPKLGRPARFPKLPSPRHIPERYEDKTLSNYHLWWSALFNFAIEKEYLIHNPMAKVVCPECQSDKDVEVLTVTQTEALLNAALKMAPAILPYLAIAGFAGIRRAELLRLSWKNVNLITRCISLHPSITKTRKKRIVTIPDNLAAWLQPFAKSEGPIVEPQVSKNLDKLRKEICQHAGIKKWPHNALRHGFGSYHFALHRNETLTMAEMGHSSSEMLNNHYKRLVPPAEAQLYFGIFPPGISSEETVKLLKAI